MNGRRFRNYVFTSFDENPPSFDGARYLIYQRERCATTARDHWQGYVEYFTPTSLPVAKSHLGQTRIHLEPRKGTQSQAIEYCRKEDTRVHAPVEYGLRGHQGSRTDLDEMVELILQGGTALEILRVFRGNALRHMGCIARAQRCVLEIDETDIEVTTAREHRAYELATEARVNNVADIGTEVLGNTSQHLEYLVRF
nr:MAG: replication associated protein [Cressdnaviricota sp.]